MDGAAAYNPRTVEEVFRDFKARRIGIIRALTTDVEEFFQTCDPQKENLCLYGFPNESWEVNLPAEEVPPEMPEPALGINFARDGMREKDWLNMVAVHSDAWLLSVAYYFGARFNFGQNDRKRLFNMINDLPTIFEVVSGIANIKSPPSKSNSTSKSKAVSDPYSRNPKPQKRQVKQEDEISSEEDEEGGEGGLDEEQILAEKDNGEDEEKDEEDHGETLCGACRENYASDEFWICCDLCEKWFHGKCVKITPAKAQHIKQYKCPACTNNKRARAS